MLPRTKYGRSLAALSLLPLLTAATNLPYNPTRIHLTSQPDGKNRAFIIQPGSDSTVSAQLSVLDLSDSIAASSPSPKPLSSSLPFLSKDAATAYTSFLDAGGNITVLAGDCTQGVDGATLWRLTPDASAQNGGSWSKDKIEANTQAGVTGANFLNTAIAFSEVVKGNVTTTDLYAFGGMCPNAGTSNANWVSNAAYNNDMVTFSPHELAAGQEDYNVAPVTSKGPPIAEAGMSMTALSPSFSNSSGVQTQQQDFVVLGGHTQNAFINMSQVALFSLPQAVWSFLPVQQPAGASSVSSPGYVTPRSGHSAVLTEDGRSIIVFGGWVGDTNTPATPQLVVLQIGSGYGGSGSWQWNPVSTPSGSFSGTPGVYGHGAVMLPGNVMMIMGGYSISTSASSRLARRDTPTQNTRTFLYNVTSNSWLTSYSAPADTSEDQSSGGSSGSLSTPSQKAGVGVGVTFGVFALVGVGGLYAWNSKRSKRRRVNRDSTAFNLVEDKTSFDEGWNNHKLTGGRENTSYGYDAGSPTREAFPWLPELGQNGWKNQQAPIRDISSTGAFLNIPSPTRGLRRSSSGRNYQYQPTPAEDTRPISGIHPIVETDEEGYASNSSSRPGTADANKRLLAAQTIFDPRLKRKRPGTSEGENPFADPPPNPLGSHPVSPDLDNNASGNAFQGLPPTFALPAPSQNRNTALTSVQDWASAREYNDPRASTGRSSPTKSSSTDDRTMSNLSDMSSRSYQSARSIPRTGSQRSQVPFGFAGVSRITPLPSPQEERTFSFESSGRRSPQRGLGRNRSVTSPTRATYHRPQLSLDQLRAEGELALGGTLEQQRQAINRPPSSLYSHEERSMSPAPTSPARRRMNWVGSLRKALGTYTALERSGSGASIHPPPPLDINPIPYTDRSTTPSPTRNRPQRTASDSSAFLRLKRGKTDWDQTVGDGNAWEPYTDEPDTGDWGDVSPVHASTVSPSVRVVHDDEWDVENAASRRDVQVMFTVPKARLRVVNADPERASVRSVSEGSKKGKSPALHGGEFKTD
ncbi:hypothetical protein K461DRAFT_265171 [Myriangium duriaei CBS 260.36]|uniref:Galactose oxidase-like Early set domain-containing protein n=1 Tax=Myriangium duriaei CBS 260.36 TaxID=1168546 RepID=A0A9P4J901_9PEZI|nr:hypothetical protein K461DRAFT_265171 [Myriangium duriaei CBS 260.36]